MAGPDDSDGSKHSACETVTSRRSYLVAATTLTTERAE